jgi:hypothetical protein
MWWPSFGSARPRCAGVSLGLLVASLLTACSDPLTSPPSALSRPALDLVTLPTKGSIAAVDLGALPGDAWSEATFVGADGAVYGRSVSASGTPRFFRWTQAGGMVQVSTIPTRTVYPLPAVGGPFPFVYQDAFVYAANAKGEATGWLCPGDCGTDPDPGPSPAHVFRYSSGAGAVELDTRRFGEPPDLPLEPGNASHGKSINRWGHITGKWWDQPENDEQTFFWTPIDSFQLVGTVEDRSSEVNDIDQVIGSTQIPASTQCSFVWRTDLGRHTLLTPAGECYDPDSDALARALAQQVSGPLVVGWVAVRVGDGRQQHAALWRVPAPDRAAYPAVNASPFSYSTRLSLGATGGRYHQLFQATQTSNAGPYVELVDWGDGTSSRRPRASLAGGLFYQAHTYTKPGTYWVRVYVKDAQGRWGVDERRLTVTS